METFTSITLEQLLGLIEQQDKRLFVLFGTEWQSGLDLLSFPLHSLSQKYQNTYKFLKLDIEVESEATRMFNIQYLPTFIIFYDGKIQEYFSGIISKKKIEHKLLKVLQMEEK